MIGQEIQHEQVLMTPENEQMLKESYFHTGVFAKTFLPHHFRRDFSTVHDPIFKAFDNPYLEIVVIKAPRSIGKTTLLQALALKTTVFPDPDKKKYGIWLSETVEKAAEDLEMVRTELAENDNLAALGPFKSSQWAEGRFTTLDGFRWLARGAKTQVRGKKWGKDRPGYIFIDDLEGSEKTESEEQRDKLKKWFFSDILGSRDLAMGTGQEDEYPTRVIMIGTFLGHDCLLQNLIDDPEIPSIELQLCDESNNMKSNYPDWIDDKGVRKLYNFYRRHDELDTFYREYQGIEGNPKTKTFKDIQFKDRYFNEMAYRDSIKKGEISVESVVLCDPSKEDNFESDVSVIYGVSFDAVKHEIRLRDGSVEHRPCAVYVANAFDMADALGTYYIFVEKHGIGEWIMYQFENEAQRRGKPYVITPLEPGNKKKEVRVGALQPFAHNGMIWLNEAPEIHGPLLTSLLQFPKPKVWGPADCFSYLIQAFDLGELYMQSEPDEEYEDDDEREDAELARLEMLDKMEEYVCSNDNSWADCP